MAIPGSATYNAVPLGAIIAAQADAEPLRALHGCGNGLYLSHRPAALLAAPTDTVKAAARTFELAIYPSADGLPYTTVLDVEATGVGTVTVTVTKSQDGAATWSAHATLTQATLAGTAWYVITDSARTLPADVTHLRYEVSTSGTSCWLSGICVYPDPAALAYGQNASLFNVFDDGILAATGGPIHVEHVNRLGANALAILADRVQAALCFCQPNAHADATERFVPAFGAAVPLALPLMRVYLPGQVAQASNPLRLTIAARGAVQAGGTTTDALTVTQERTEQGPTPTGVALDLDGDWHTADLECFPEGSDLGRYVDLRAAFPYGDTAHYVELYTLQAFWRPVT